MYVGKHSLFINILVVTIIIINKAIPVTGRGDPQVCETSRLPHFLDNRLRDCSEVVSFTRRLVALHP
jgi:hypothetical protein